MVIVTYLWDFRQLYKAFVLLNLEAYPWFSVVVSCRVIMIISSLVLLLAPGAVLLLKKAAPPAESGESMACFFSSGHSEGHLGRWAGLRCFGVRVTR